MRATVADCKLGEKLIEGIDADYLLADKGYDSDAIIEAAKLNGMESVIPPKKIAKSNLTSIEKSIRGAIW